MDSEKVIKRDNAYVLHTYNRNPVVLEKGHGLYAEGPEGQKYLDFTSGIGVNSLGYCDLAWAEAVSQQAHKLQHTSNLYYTAPCGKLAKKLCKRTGMSKVFFGNSGAEANEGAIKAARKYSVDHYGKDRYNVITLVNSFHGRTLATLTATGQEVFHNYFGPFNEGFQYVPAGDIEALQELVDRHTCAVMMELIQGEGGVMALDPDYVQAVRALCDEKDLVLIVDEVQTGVGRTGTFLCCEHYNLKPVSFFEPFKYYAELFLRDSAPCVGNAYSCFGRCRLVRNFDIALYGIFQCVRYEVAQNLLDAHRILLYQVGSCRVAFLERYAFRYVGLAFGATFIYQVGEVAPDRGQLYVSGFYLR